MKNHKIVVAYDGFDFHGWQRQPDRETIQGAIENTLAGIAGKRVPIIGSGRTDAGVHAAGQVVSFNADLTLDIATLLRALNAGLPWSIRILSVHEVPLEFQARKSALSKVYQYRIFNQSNISPFLLRYTLFHPFPLDVEAMKEAALLFQRQADFSAFSSNKHLNPLRWIKRSRVRQKGNEIIYTVEADGFLRYMVRTMAGALLEIGKGKLRSEMIEELFQKKKRSLKIPTAPAHGLCLLKVNYPPEFCP
ncbi:MAG: tRNA pseudouridine(38-40) synthase TruA [Acidobacteriota bacterium]